MDRLLIAPSVSPSSMARVVPMAWDALPMATPFATRSSTRISFKKPSATMLPSTPVMQMATAVMDG